MGSHNRYICGHVRFGLNWDQFEDAERIWETVGRSPFTAKIASEILGKDVHKFSPTIAVYRRNKVIVYDHCMHRIVDGKIAGGRVIDWYRFTEQWHYWYTEIYPTSKAAQKVRGESDGVTIHAK